MAERLEQLVQMLAAEPNDSFCMYGIAMEYVKRGDLQQAIEWFDRTIGVDPRHCYAYFHKAKALHALGHDTAASETLTLGLSQARSCHDYKAASEISAMLDELQE